ncbi:MAG: superoxide dismutase [Eubacterium sp.]
MENNRYPFINLPLPYDYDALEPFIDERTMRLHHDRHLQAYIDNLNRVVSKYHLLQRLTLKQLACSHFNIPAEDIRTLKNNAGGVFNHRFFFSGLTTEKTVPNGRLLMAIEKQFGSIDEFKKEFKKSAMSVFGSGYAWLTQCDGNLKIVTTANQDTPLCFRQKPILTIDVWEHAYYLKHYNLRADYIDDWFNVLNWDFAQSNYKSLY